MNDKKQIFIKAIKDNEGLIYRIASVYTNNPDDKADLIQEIIYQLWKSFDGFNEQSALSTWMYRIALNVAIYQLKISKRRVQTMPIEEQMLNYADEDTRQMEQKWEAIRQQVETLNLLDKAIVMLYLDNKSYQEIAGIVGISESNVGTRMQRIKEKLKKQNINTPANGTK